VLGLYGNAIGCGSSEAACEHSSGFSPHVVSPVRSRTARVPQPAEITQFILSQPLRRWQMMWGAGTVWKPGVDGNRSSDIRHADGPERSLSKPSPLLERQAVIVDKRHRPPPHMIEVDPGPPECFCTAAAHAEAPASRRPRD